MKMRMFSNVARIISSTSPALLVAISFGLIAADSAQALTPKEEERLWNQATLCVSTAGQVLSQCIDECGVLFFRRCIGACNTTYLATGNACWAGTPFVNSGTSAFNDTAAISPNGKTIRIGGPLDCPEGATATLDITLTQIAGAIATGQAKVQCQADTVAFTANLKITGRNEFLPFGKAEACGLAQISRHGENGTAFQWCREVTALPEGVELEDPE